MPCTASARTGKIGPGAAAGQFALQVETLLIASVVIPGKRHRATAC